MWLYTTKGINHIEQCNTRICTVPIRTLYKNYIRIRIQLLYICRKVGQSKLGPKDPAGFPGRLRRVFTCKTQSCICLIIIIMDGWPNDMASRQFLKRLYFYVFLLHFVFHWMWLSEQHLASMHWLSKWLMSRFPGNDLWRSFSKSAFAKLVDTLTSLT